MKLKTKIGKLDSNALRHTFESLPIPGSVHPKTVKKLMRHSDINLTMNIYTHVQESEPQVAKEVLRGFETQIQRNRHTPAKHNLAIENFVGLI